MLLISWKLNSKDCTKNNLKLFGDNPILVNTFKMHNVGTVQMIQMHNVGAPMFFIYIYSQS